MIASLQRQTKSLEDIINALRRELTGARGGAGPSLGPPPCSGSPGGGGSAGTQVSPCRWEGKGTGHRHLEHAEGGFCQKGILPVHPFLKSNPMWAAVDIKTVRGNINLYGVGKFGKSVHSWPLKQRWDVPPPAMASPHARSRVAYPRKKASQASYAAAATLQRVALVGCSLHEVHLAVVVALTVPDEVLEVTALVHVKGGACAAPMVAALLKMLRHSRDSVSIPGMSMRCSVRTKHVAWEMAEIGCEDLPPPWDTPCKSALPARMGTPRPPRSTQTMTQPHGGVPGRGASGMPAADMEPAPCLPRDNVWRHLSPCLGQHSLSAPPWRWQCAAPRLRPRSTSQWS